MRAVPVLCWTLCAFCKSLSPTVALFGAGWIVKIDENEWKAENANYTYSPGNTQNGAPAGVIAERRGGLLSRGSGVRLPPGALAFLGNSESWCRLGPRPTALHWGSSLSGRKVILLASQWHATSVTMWTSARRRGKAPRTSARRR